MVIIYIVYVLYILNENCELYDNLIIFLLNWYYNFVSCYLKCRLYLKCWMM